MTWKDRLKAIPLLYDTYRAATDRVDAIRWRMRGRPLPPPHRIKQLCVLEYRRRYGLDTLVETGTHLGNMIRATRGRFRDIYSIELSAELHRAARERFRRDRAVHLLEGDSATVLSEVVGRLQSPTLFWLDAHYSGGFTARSTTDTPIVQELETILRRNVAGDVILIDDARCFDGTSGYLRLDDLRALIESRRPGWQFAVENDIIRIAPKP